MNKETENETVKETEDNGIPVNEAEDNGLAANETEDTRVPMNEAEDTGASVKKTKKSGFLAEALIYLALILFAMFVVPNYILQRTVVDGPSMKDTLHSGESLLVEKVSKHFTDPKRYAIIIFDPPEEVKEDKDKNDYFVKRLFGLPGETIEIKDGKIYINGEIIDDHYGKDPMTEEDNMKITLAEDEFFVLGDNRSLSLDSRTEELGPIKRDMLVGRMLLRVWPLSQFGVPD